MRTSTAGGSGCAAQQPGGRDAVELRHADVHQDDVGLVQVNSREHVAAVGGLADDVEVRGAGQHDPQAGADQRVVVDEEDADRVVGTDGRTQDEVARRVDAMLRVPPISATRSARPISPVPAPGAGRRRLQRRPAGARRASGAAAKGGAPPGRGG